MGESSPVKVQVFLHKDDMDAALSQAQHDSPPIIEVASQPKSREDIQAPASWQQDYAPLRLASIVTTEAYRYQGIFTTTMR
jgi:hypothetical protein